MTVKELIEILDGVNPSYQIVIETDEVLAIEDSYVTDTENKRIVLETMQKVPNPYDGVGTAWHPPKFQKDV
jgi:hypothetical protein